MHRAPRSCAHPSTFSRSSTSKTRQAAGPNNPPQLAAGPRAPSPARATLVSCPPADAAMLKAACISLLGALVASSSAMADDGVTAGAFVGAHVFSPTIELGVVDRPGSSSGRAPSAGSTPARCSASFRRRSGSACSRPTCPSGGGWSATRRRRSGGPIRRTGCRTTRCSPTRSARASASRTRYATATLVGVW